MNRLSAQTSIFLARCLSRAFLKRSQISFVQRWPEDYFKCWPLAGWENNFLPSSLDLVLTSFPSWPLSAKQVLLTVNSLQYCCHPTRRPNDSWIFFRTIGSFWCLDIAQAKFDCSSAFNRITSSLRFQHSAFACRNWQAVVYGLFDIEEANE